MGKRKNEQVEHVSSCNQYSTLSPGYEWGIFSQTRNSHESGCMDRRSNLASLQTCGFDVPTTSERKTTPSSTLSKSNDDRSTWRTDDWQLWMCSVRCPQNPYVFTITKFKSWTNIYKIEEFADRSNGSPQVVFSMTLPIMGTQIIPAYFLWTTYCR